MTAGFDPLRDDGEAYVERLRGAGVAAFALPFPGQVHGFLNIDGAIPSCDRATAAVVDAIRRRWTDRADEVKTERVAEAR